MSKSGLASVTFRRLNYKEIISLTKEALLNGIEWGGDIHVPAGDAQTAALVGKATVAAGLSVLSYGSYFNVGADGSAAEDFVPALSSAVKLKAPVIRVWAGDKGSAVCGREYFKQTVSNTQTICDMAMQENITVCFEYHRDTPTDNSKSAVSLIKAAGRKNLKTYWQPNPDISFEKNLTELSDVLPYLEHIHVFHWPDNARHPLSGGFDQWQEYINIIKSDGKPHSYILEFVKDDSAEQFLEDAHALLALIK